MSEETIKKVAEATTEVAAATSKFVEASEKFGTFVSQYLGEPLNELSGIATDYLKVKRWKNRMNYCIRVQKKLQELGYVPDQKLPLKVGIPLFENISLEDDGFLQDTWANLLINFSNSKSRINPSVAFVEVLRTLSSLEVQILQKVYELPFQKALHGGVKTSDLPLSASIIPENGKSNNDALPSDEVLSALSNLDRLGCLRALRTLGGGQVFTGVNPTVFGRDLVAACTLKN